MYGFVRPPTRIDLCNIFLRNGRGVHAEFDGKVQQRHVGGRQVGVSVIAQELIEALLRFTEQTQHLIVRRGGIRIATCRRECQEQAFLLLARKSPVLKEDRRGHAGFGLNQPWLQALAAEERRHESKVISKGSKGHKGGAQFDLSEKTHSYVILARPAWPSLPARGVRDSLHLFP